MQGGFAPFWGGEWGCGWGWTGAIGSVGGHVAAVRIVCDSRTSFRPYDGCQTVVIGMALWESCGWGEQRGRSGGIPLYASGRMRETWEVWEISFCACAFSVPPYGFAMIRRLAVRCYKGCMDGEVVNRS